MCDKLVLTWKDVPYRENGRDKKGVDCVGLVYAMFAELGIRLPGSTIPKTNTADLLGLLRGSFAVVRGKPKAYDFLFFQLSGNGVLHCGVYVGYNLFVHVLGAGGVKVDSIFRWRPQLIKSYRYKGDLCQPK